MAKKIAFVAPEEKRTLVWNTEAATLAKTFGFEIIFGDTPETADSCDGVITTWGSPCFSRNVLDSFPSIKILGHAAGSVGIVTDSSTYDTNVTVISANPVMAKRVAEWALMMVLAIRRNLFFCGRIRRNEILDWSSKEKYPVKKDSSIGIWGLGDISRTLLHFCKELDLGRIQIYSRHGNADEILNSGAFPAKSFDELLQQSEILICFPGLTSETRHQLDAAHLALLPDGATIINAGRAALVDSDALIAELRSGRLHAVLDVFDIEPLPADSVWNSLPNLVMTPHMGASGGTASYAPWILKEFHRFFSRASPQGIIDRKRFLTMSNDHLIQKKG